MRTVVLRQRYLRKDADGNVVETPQQMFRRVADAISASESKYGASDDEQTAIADEFCELMVDEAFLPNSPTLMNAGRENEMLSACFVLPVEDSIEAIFDAVKHAALIQKAGGGTGFSLDRLWPTGDIVKSSGGRTSGPISFMKVFSEGTSAIQQGAFRRGANMGMMSIEHPDILHFIYTKKDPRAFTNFNLSVKVSNDFMKQLEDNPDTPHLVMNPRTDKRYVAPRSINIGSYTIDDLLPKSWATDGCFTVQEVWDMIVKNAHGTGEPGFASSTGSTKTIRRLTEMKSKLRIRAVSSRFCLTKLVTWAQSMFPNSFPRPDVIWTGIHSPKRFDSRSDSSTM